MVKLLIIQPNIKKKPFLAKMFTKDSDREVAAINGSKILHVKP